MNIGRKPLRFKTDFTFDQRKTESERVRMKYADKIPIICEQAQSYWTASTSPHLQKSKYLVPYDITIAHFIYVIRKRIQLPPEDAVFLFINGNIYAQSMLLSDIYEKEKDPDGFLYVQFAKENVFG